MCGLEEEGGKHLNNLGWEGLSYFPGSGISFSMALQIDWRPKGWSDVRPRGGAGAVPGSVGLGRSEGCSS